MPTETNKSPLKLDPVTILSLGIKQKQGQQEAVQDYAKQVRQDLGIEEGQKGIFGGLLRSDEFKDLSLGKKLGIYGKGLFHSGVGGIEGVTGMDLLKDAPEEPVEPVQPKYTTNIDTFTGDEIPEEKLSPFTKNGKIMKTLTGITDSASILKMSAKKASQEEKFKSIAQEIPMMKKGEIDFDSLNKGGLHRALNIPEDEKIPVSKLTIKPGDSEHMRKMKQFAINARKFKK
tara:strand:- start:540 stop:1232 length:693 start_codon:yes stop_codon:yes gene_type:complete